MNPTIESSVTCDSSQEETTTIVCDSSQEETTTIVCDSSQEETTTIEQQIALLMTKMSNFEAQKLEINETIAKLKLFIGFKEPESKCEIKDGYIAKLTADKLEIVNVYVNKNSAALLNGYPSWSDLESDLNSVDNRNSPNRFWNHLDAQKGFNKTEYAAYDCERENEPNVTAHKYIYKRFDDCENKEAYIKNNNGVESMLFPTSSFMFESWQKNNPRLWG